MVTRISYSFVKPSDNQANYYNSLPIVSFFNKDLFPNLQHLSLAGSPKWLSYEYLVSIAKALGNSLKSLSLSSITARNVITETQFARVFTACSYLSRS
jgi:hypothetical protein